MPRSPDGRTVLTTPDAHDGSPGRLEGAAACVAFILGTNAIEALNRQRRRAIKTKVSFPSEDATRKLVYLAPHNAVPQWPRTRNWTVALLAFKIHFGDRVSDTTS